MPRLRRGRGDEAPGLANQGRRYGAADGGHRYISTERLSRLAATGAAGADWHFWLGCAKQRGFLRAAACSLTSGAPASTGTAANSRIRLVPAACVLLKTQSPDLLCLANRGVFPKTLRTIKGQSGNHTGRLGSPPRLSQPPSPAPRAATSAALDAVAATLRKDTYLTRSTAPRSRSAASSWRAPSSLLFD